MGGPEGKEGSRKSKIEKKSEERKGEDNLMMKSLRCRRRWRRGREEYEGREI